MASLSRVKHLFGFTSPRTLEKIIPELEILNNNFSSQSWNPQTQENFFRVLFESDYYDGETFPTDPAFAARDRINRAPKALGFIQLKPHISLTEAGKKLVKKERLSELFTKQLMKFQLPSPYHTQSSKRDFNVKPYLELLRLTHDLNTISKTEIALYFLQLTNYAKYNDIKQKILNFRTARKQTSVSWRQFVSQCFENEIKIIFEEEIASSNFSVRESSSSSIEQFIKTKERNMRDYADAFIRYLRATELVTLDEKTLHLKISKIHKDRVEFILKNIPRQALQYNLREYEDYLFNPKSIKLLTDDKKLIIDSLKKLKFKPNEEDSLDNLKNQLMIEEEKNKKSNIESTINTLKLRNDMSDIYDIFDKISKKQLSDAPLFLEWNTWRAFAALNHADSISGHFITDIEGMPLNTAAGNQADIEIHYKHFSCIVEVTMSRGETQFNMENSSVPRHYGDLIKKLDSHKKGYCFFIAPNISQSTKAHFFNLNRFNTKTYGGKTRIIPMNLGNFISFLRHGIDENFSNPQSLQKWLDKLCNFNQEAEDEDVWFDFIEKSANNWISIM